MSDQTVGVYILLKIKDINSGWRDFISSTVNKVKLLGNPNLYEYYVNNGEIDLHERFPNNEAWLRHIDYFTKEVAKDFLNHFEIKKFRVYGPVNDKIKEVGKSFEAKYFDAVGKI